MRTTFRHHYERPSDDDVDAALVHATVVLDTNVLLGLYRVSPELRKTRLSVLNKIGERLFVPYQVGLEFHRNRPSVARDITREYADLLDGLAAIRKVASNFGGKNRYEESAARVQGLVDPALEKVQEELNKLKDTDSHSVDLKNDPVLEALEELLENRVGKAPSPKKLARRVQEFVTVRIPLQFPPGYADTSKIEAHGPGAAAGDYLLWREVLTMARRNQTDVVLITDDAKPDWWSIGRSSGLPTVAHPLLISEFREKTGHAYYQLSSYELLKRAGALDVAVSDDDLEEEEDLLTEQVAQDAMGSRVQRADFLKSLATWNALNDYEASLGSERLQEVIRSINPLGTQSSLNAYKASLGSERLQEVIRSINPLGTQSSLNAYKASLGSERLQEVIRSINPLGTQSSLNAYKASLGSERLQEVIRSINPLGTQSFLDAYKASLGSESLQGFLDSRVQRADLHARVENETDLSPLDDDDRDSRDDG